jgi:hypothetical protein
MALGLGLFAATAQAGSSSQAGQPTRLYEGQRVSRSLISVGNFVVFPSEQENLFRVIDFTTGLEKDPIPSAGEFPAKVFRSATGDLIGVSFHDNRATVIDSITLQKKGELDLGGYTDVAGEFVSYWMMDGCSMPNGDLYFVSAVDVALVRVPANGAGWELVADQDSAGLSGSSEIACVGDKLVIANHKSMLTSEDNELLVLSLKGEVLEKILTPGLLRIQGQGNTLVAVSSPTPSNQQGWVRFFDASGDRLSLLAQDENKNYPQMIAFDPQGGRVHVAEKFPAGFSTYDLSTFKRMEQHTFAPEDGVDQPRGIATSEDGSRVFIEASGSIYQLAP